MLSVISIRPIVITHRCSGSVRVNTLVFAPVCSLIATERNIYRRAPSPLRVGWLDQRRPHGAGAEAAPRCKSSGCRAFATARVRPSRRHRRVVKNALERICSAERIPRRPGGEEGVRPRRRGGWAADTDHHTAGGTCAQQRTLQQGTFRWPPHGNPMYVIRFIFWFTNTPWSMCNSNRFN